MIDVNLSKTVNEVGSIGIDMIRALYTGTSGMRVQQHKIDSIGNNIANT